MNIANLAIILTDDCNFDCSYCRMPKHRDTIPLSTLETAIPFFTRHLAENAVITFFGGEPLLEFPLIRDAVRLFERVAPAGRPVPQFTITTNGSLLDDEMLAFFHRHDVSLLVSYDGDAHDDCRANGSRRSVEAALRRAQSYDRVKLSTNSVFTPETVHKLSASLIGIAGMGIADIEFSLDQLAPWSDESLDTLQTELHKLLQFTADYHHAHGRIPFPEFRHIVTDEPETFACGGGKNRMAIAPDSRIWGCTHFHSYFKTHSNTEEYATYCFGLLDEFISGFDLRYPEILGHHTSLRQDMFHSGDRFCFLCPSVSQCKICPVYAGRATGAIGDIPPWMCRVAAIMNTARTTRL